MDAGDRDDRLPAPAVPPDHAPRRARAAILRDWKAAGGPLCPVCGTEFAADDRFRVSQPWQAVVHPYCLYSRPGRPSRADLERGLCTFYPDCPIPFPGSGGYYCVCPW